MRTHVDRISGVPQAERPARRKPRLGVGAGVRWRCPVCPAWCLCLVQVPHTDAREGCIAWSKSRSTGRPTAFDPASRATPVERAIRLGSATSALAQISMAANTRRRPRTRGSTGSNWWCVRDDQELVLSQVAGWRRFRRACEGGGVDEEDYDSGSARCAAQGAVLLQQRVAMSPRCAPRAAGRPPSASREHATRHAGAI